MHWDLKIYNLEQIIFLGTENSLYECNHWTDNNYGHNECTPG